MRIFGKKHIGVLLLVFFSFFCVYGYAQGLLGGALEDFGRATGIKPIEDLGRNADDEHRRIKNNNPNYKRFEEDATEFIKRPFNLACTIPYQAITNAVIARCSNWDGRMEDQHLIEQAKRRLIDSGVFLQSDFSGIQIRWCPLSGAHGMAPDRGRIYLDVSGKNDNPINVAALLAHEVKHIQQYRRLGTDRFKCTYSEQYVGCGACQNRHHGLEREAYNFQDAVYNRLSSFQEPPSYQYTAPQRSYQPISNRCGTPFGFCTLYQPGPIGAQCYCSSRRGPVYGVLVQ